MLVFTIAVPAQTNNLSAGSDTIKDTNHLQLNPLFRSALRNSKKTDNLLIQYIKPTKHELMYWPNYPLNATQIEARDRDWDRKYNQPFGKQIANIILESYINSLLYGKKYTPATVPKF